MGLEIVAVVSPSIDLDAESFLEDLCYFASAQALSADSFRVIGAEWSSLLGYASRVSVAKSSTCLISSGSRSSILQDRISSLLSFRATLSERTAIDRLSSRIA